MPDCAPAVDAAIDVYLASLLGKSPRTQATYASALRRFVEFLAERQPGLDCDRVDRLPGTVGEDYYYWLLGQYGRERRATVLTYLAALRAFVRFLDRRGWCPSDASYERLRNRLSEVVGRGQYRTPRIDRRIPLIVLQVDGLALPPNSPALQTQRLTLLRDRALLHVLYSSGMRREELARLNRTDLDDGWRADALITGKGDKERVVFVGDEALAAVRQYVEERADPYLPLFLRHDRGRGLPGPGGNRYRLSPHSIWEIVKTYARQVGVAATPHAFRHTKASVLLNRGAKLSEVQDLLGHASPETTKRIYAHYEVAHLRDAFDRFSASAEDLAAELQAARGVFPPPAADRPGRPR
jgi:site-specific recombinase XerD